MRRSRVADLRSDIDIMDIMFGSAHCNNLDEEKETEFENRNRETRGGFSREKRDQE